MALPNSNVLGNQASVDNDTFATEIENFLDAVKELTGTGAGTALSCVSNDVTPPTAHRGFLTVDSEDANDDDLDHIIPTNVTAGTIFVIKAANSGRTITVKHGIGGSGEFQLDNGADFALDNTDKMICVRLDGSQFVELWRKYGVDRAGALAHVGGVGVASLDSVWIPVDAMYPAVTAGAAAPASAEIASNQPVIRHMEFSNASDEHAQFTIEFPKRWNAGTVTFQPVWTGLVSGTGEVSWAMKAVARSDGQSIGTSYGTAVSVEDNFISVNDVHKAPVSAALTISGAAKQKPVFFDLFRNVAGETSGRAAPANLLGVMVFFNTDAGTDA